MGGAQSKDPVEKCATCQSRNPVDLRAWLLRGLLCGLGLAAECRDILFNVDMRGARCPGDVNGAIKTVHDQGGISSNQVAVISGLDVANRIVEKDPAERVFLRMGVNDSARTLSRVFLEPFIGTCESLGAIKHQCGLVVSVTGCA